MPTLPMNSPPENELGVVYLFADYCRRHNLRIRKIKAGFPDCLVVRQDAEGEHTFNVEFEFRSSSFRAHGHNAADVDWIVCWKDDWLDSPPSVQVIELRSYYGFGLNIWHQHVGAPDKFAMLARPRFEALIDRRSRPGDLVLFEHYWTNDDASHGFRGSGLMYVIARVASCVSGRRFKLQRVCLFDTPISLTEDVFGHASIRKEQKCLTASWPEVRRRICHLRPEAQAKLERYAT